MGVAERAKGEGATGDDEGCSVADLRNVAGEELVSRSVDAECISKFMTYHDVSGHHQRSTADEQNRASVNAPADERDENRKERANNVRWHGVQLLRYNRVARVNRADNCWSEEGQSLNSDVVQQEDERGSQNDGIENATERLLPVKFIKDFVLANALRLNTCNGEVLLFLAEPPSSLWSICEGEERDECENASDDALDSENHSPARQRAKGVKGEDRGSEETAKGTSKRSHDNVK